MNSLQLTLKQKSLIEDAEIIRSKSAKQAGFFGLTSWIFAQATIPHRDPNQKTFTRKNGNLTLSITDVADVGLPYGSTPRLILAWLTTEAYLKQSRTIELGHSIKYFMNSIGIHKVSGGKNGSINRVKSQAQKLFSSSINYKIVNKDGMEFGNSSIAKRTVLFWNENSSNSRSVWPSEVELTTDFYNEIIARPIPIDLMI